MNKEIDYTLIVVTLILCIVGLTVIYSATFTDKEQTRFIYQCVFIGIGWILLILVSMLDYHWWGKFARHIYLIIIVTLLLVLLIGEVIRGSQRWLSAGPISIQPSEFTKLMLIITIASFLTKYKGKINSTINLIKLGLHISIPVILVMLQPDLGTSIILSALGIGLAYAGGVKPVYLGIATFLGIVSGYLKLAPYQKTRLLIFLNPYNDPTGDGWNIIQSEIAIGSGQLKGKSWLAGTQSHLNFLPEKTTDFIFAVFAEEWGFIGTFILITLYFILIWKAFTIASRCKSALGGLLSYGIGLLFFLHVLINIGMTSGIMPVTGITLPFISYGGSSLITNLVAIGILLNIYKQESKSTFYDELSGEIT